MTGHRIPVLWLIKGLGLGGAEKLLINAAPYLDRDEFDYQVGYFLPWKDALAGDLDDLGFRVTCFNSRGGWDVSAYRSVRRYLELNHNMVLHAHLPWAGIIGRIAARAAKVPAIVYTEHGSWTRLNPITRAINRSTLSINDVTIAVSQDVRESMRSARGEIRTIANGIDCSAFESVHRDRAATRRALGIADDEFVIGKVANLSPVKNHEMLISAFAEFQRAVSPSRLLLVGQLRDRRAHLNAVSAGLGIGDRVIITGPRTDIPQLLDVMDVFAMSSHTEGLPVSLLEAMAMAKPVVCTAVGGIPRVIRDGEHGRLVPPGDASAMTTAFLDLWSAAGKRRELGIAAKLRVRCEFDIRGMVEQVEDIYREILRRKGVLDRNRPVLV